MRFLTPDVRFGATLESLLDRRERLAHSKGPAYGSDFVGRQLVETVLSHVKPGMRVLEVDPAAGLFTRLFVGRGAEVVALEPSPTFAAELATHESDNLMVVRGFTEDIEPALAERGEPLPSDRAALADNRFDIAVVTFPARRGMGLLALINELTLYVSGYILVILPDDGSLDWAYLLRASAIEGAESTVRFVSEGKPADDDTLVGTKRSVVLRVDRLSAIVPMRLEEAWNLEARSIEVPYPVPRGAATRLVRYFMAGGDRSVIIKTEPEGITRLHGNLRTAAHRIARDEVTVRRTDDGIQLMLIPREKS